MTRRRTKRGSAKKNARLTVSVQRPFAELPRRPSPNAETHEERFADQIADVRPLRFNNQRIGKRASASLARSSVKHQFEVQEDGLSVAGRRTDVHPRELERLQRGAYACDGTLDLHRLGVADARLRFDEFLSRSASEGARVVEIIHGKGLHSPSGNGILRGEVGAWASQGSSAKFVRAFVSVLEGDGQAGRLRVLLQPIRPRSS